MAQDQRKKSLFPSLFTKITDLTTFEDENQESKRQMHSSYGRSRTQSPSAAPTLAPTYSAATLEIILRNVVGNGYPGYGGDQGLAANSYLRSPSDLVLDTSANIFVSDTANNIIRVVAASTGVITTYAGKVPLKGSNSAYPCDNCLASTSTLEYPQQITVDSSGNLYIADYGHNVVRLVTKSTGIITTYAGTVNKGASNYCDGQLATSAVLGQPYGVALDASSNLYISDLATDMIRVVNFQTKIISTFAGINRKKYSGINTPFATVSLNGPAGMAVYDGSLFVADAYNDVVRSIKIATGVSTIVAGTLSSSGCDGDGRSATSSLLDTPGDVAMDGLGNIYIADSGNSRIRLVVLSTGAISTFAGLSRKGYNGDGNAAVASSLNLPFGVFVFNSLSVYIADSGNNLIRLAVQPSVPGAISYTPTRVPSVAPSVINASPTIPTSRPTGIPTCGTTSGTTLVDVVSVVSPFDVAISSSNVLYVSTACSVVGISLTTLVTTSTVGIVNTCGVSAVAGLPLLSTSSPSTFLLNQPTYLALDSSDTLYIVDYGNTRIISVGNNAELSTVINQVGAPVSSDILQIPVGFQNTLAGIAIDSAVGTVYFAVNSNANLQANQVFSFIPGVSTSLTLYASMGPVLYGLYVGTIPHNAMPPVVSFNPTTEVFAGTILGVMPLAPISENPGGSIMLSNTINDIVIASNGDIYGTSASGNVIYKAQYISNPAYLTSNNYYYAYVPEDITFAGIAGTAGYAGSGYEATMSPLNGPTGLGLDACNTLYIADTNNNKIRKVI